MKKIFLATLLFTLVFTASPKLNKSDSKQYEIGIKYFKNKQYEKSYKVFDDLFFTNLANFNVNLHLGKSAFEIRNYDVAISTYERMLISQSNNFQVQLELARSFFAIKNYKSSKDMFEKIKINIKSKKIVVIINKYLQKIKEEQEKEAEKATTHFQGIFVFKTGYDTNIYTRASSDEFFIPLFKLDFNNTTKDEKAFYNQEIVILEHKYINGPFNIKNNLLILNKHFYSLDKKTTQVFVYSPKFGYQHTKNLNSNLKLHIGKIISESGKTSNYGITPKLSYKINNTNILKASLKYQKNNAIQTSNNSNNLDFILSLKSVVSPQIIIFSSLKAEALRYETTSSSKDYDVLQLILGLSYRVSSKLSMQLKGNYKNTKYKNINNFYLKKQINNDMAYSFSSNYAINKQWSIQGIVNYLDVQSNIPSSAYNKYDISLSILRSF